MSLQDIVPGAGGMQQHVVWDAAVTRLRERVSPQNYDMWLRPIELTSWDGTTLRLRAPNSYIRFWFESNFLTSLVRELHDLGHENVRIEFETDREETRPAPTAPEPNVPLAVPVRPTIAAPAPVVTSAMTDDDGGIV